MDSTEAFISANGGAMKQGGVVLLSKDVFNDIKQRVSNKSISNSDLDALVMKKKLIIRFSSVCKNTEFLILERGEGGELYIAYPDL